MASEALQEFQRRLWRAWDASDLDGVAECVAEDFHGTFAGPDGSPLLEADRLGLLELLRSSFAQTRGQQVRWTRGECGILQRGPRDAAAMMRVACSFPEHPHWDNEEVTVEAYRCGEDGRWLLVRAHSERLR